MDHLLSQTYLAEREHFWFKGFRQFIAPLIAQGLDGISSPRALDCGCGTGSNLELLDGHASGFGFDLTRSGLSYAQRAGYRRIVHASIMHIPFPAAAFDLVTSFDVLQCLTEEQERQAMSEMARVLKPGGAIVLNVAALELLRGSHAADWEEVRRYTRPLMRQAVRRAGLVVERLTFTNFTIFPLMLGVRTAQRLGGGASPERLKSDMTVPAAPVNGLLTGLLSLEARALRLTDMPIGSSLLCLARKPRP